MASTGRKLAAWLLAAAALCALAYAGVRVTERRIESVVREGLSSFAQGKGMVMDVKDIRYALWNNRLAVNGLAFRNADQNGLNLSVREAELEGINRMMALRMAWGGMESLPDGVQPVASRAVVRNLHAWPSPDCTLQERVVEGLAIDMSQMKKLLDKAAASARTSEKIVQMALASVTYSQAGSKGLRLRQEFAPGQEVIFEMDEAVERGVSSGHMDECLIQGFRCLRPDGQEALSIKKTLLRQLNLSAQVQQWIYGDDNAEPSPLAVIKELFGGERSFLELCEVEGVTLAAGMEPVTLGLFRWKNPQTRPFACGLVLEKLHMPLGLTPELGSLSLLGYSQVDLDIALSGQFQPMGSSQPSELRMDVTGLNMGTVSLASQCVLDDVFSRGLQPQEMLGEGIRVKSLSLAYTEGGLVAKIAGLGRRLLGVKPESLVEMFSESMWKALPDSEKTPAKEKLLSQIKLFLNKPGKISVSLVPPAPVALGKLDSELEKHAQVEIQEGSRTLQELSL